MDDTIRLDTEVTGGADTIRSRVVIIRHLTVVLDITAAAEEMRRITPRRRRATEAIHAIIHECNNRWHAI